MDWLNDVLAFARQQFLELVLALLASVVVPYAIAWLRQKAGETFAGRVDAILKHAIQAALNKVVGTSPYAAVPPDKVDEVVDAAAEIAMAGAPQITRKIENTLRDKVLARIIVAGAKE